MAEPGKISNVERITFRYGENGDGRKVSVNVRKNRTEAELDAQLARIYKTYGDIADWRRMNKAMEIHARTRRAMSFDNRAKPINSNLSAVLVSRQNNRRK